MNRLFRGVKQGGAGECRVYVEQNAKRQRLTRRIQHVREDYCWDQAGPRSTELARAILWIVTEVEPPWALYRGFTSDVLAHVPVAPCGGGEGECWRLGEDEVRAWLRDVMWLTNQSESTKEHERSGQTAATAATAASPRAIGTWQERLRRQCAAKSATRPGNQYAHLRYSLSCPGAVCWVHA